MGNMRQEREDMLLGRAILRREYAIHSGNCSLNDVYRADYEIECLMKNRATDIAEWGSITIPRLEIKPTIIYVQSSPSITVEMSQPPPIDPHRRLYAERCMAIGIRPTERDYRNYLKMIEDDYERNEERRINEEEARKQRLHELREQHSRKWCIFRIYDNKAYYEACKAEGLV